MCRGTMTDVLGPLFAHVYSAAETCACASDALRTVLCGGALPTRKRACACPRECASETDVRHARERYKPGLKFFMGVAHSVHTVHNVVDKRRRGEKEKRGKGEEGKGKGMGKGREMEKEGLSESAYTG